MTTIEKILSRKDASSVVAAIMVAFITVQLVISLTNPLVNQVGPQADEAPALAAADFYMPAIAFLLQLFVLELVLTLFFVIRGLAYNKAAPAKKKKK